MDEARIAEIAKEAGREGARELATLLGLDINAPDGVSQAQRDFIFLRDLRLGAQAIKRKTFMTLLGAIITAALAYIALGFKVH